MIRRVPLLAILCFTLAGCGSQTSGLPPDFASLRLSKMQWAIEIPNLEETHTEKIKETLHTVPGIAEDSVLVNANGKYIAYKIGRLSGQEVDQSKVRDEAVKKLTEIGLKPGQTKTHEAAPAPPPDPAPAD